MRGHYLSSCAAFFDPQFGVRFAALGVETFFLCLAGLFALLFRLGAGAGVVVCFEEALAAFLLQAVFVQVGVGDI